MPARKQAARAAEFLDEMADFEERHQRASRRARPVDGVAVEVTLHGEHVVDPRAAPASDTSGLAAPSGTARIGSGQRGVNEQPGGSSPSGGTAALIACSRVPGAPPGIDASRPRV